MYLLTRNERDTQLLVDHQGQETHLGRTSLVQLNGSLCHLGIRIEFVPSVVNKVIAEITNEFSSGNVLHDKDFQKANETKQLDQSASGNGTDGIETTGNVRELLDIEKRE